MSIRTKNIKTGITIAAAQGADGISGHDPAF